ncbi:MAG: LysM peptidoglycan-binding domain-containing protein [Patescibacteria group bacterium]|nr:LysM peptidoglycan-binding domain-containing protein [Patescibacteria group bacterium]
MEETRPVATLDVNTGKAEIRLIDTSGWNRAVKGMTLYTGDSIRTLSGAVVTVQYFDKSITRLRENSELNIKNLQKSEKGDVVSLELTRGKMWARVAKVINENSSFEVETPTILASAKGTALEILVAKQVAQNPQTGENDETFTSQVRVLESQVDARAIDRVSSEDAQGNVRTEIRVLADVILPSGSETIINDADIQNFSQEPGRKPIVRSIPANIRSSKWYQFNEQADQIYLKSLQDEFGRIIKDMDSRGFFEKLFLSQDEKARAENARVIYYQIENQLSQIESDLEELSQNEDSSSEILDLSETQDENSSGSSAIDDIEQKPVTTFERHHIVQSGDTLNAIAQRYGVSSDVLMKTNNITDPNLIQVGQELTIPVDLQNLPEVKVPSVKPGLRASTPAAVTTPDSSTSDAVTNTDSMGKPDTNLQEAEPFASDH